MESRDTQQRGLPVQQQHIANKRREKDVMKLIVSDYEVQPSKEERTEQLNVKMKGPENSSYEGVTPHTLNLVIGSLDCQGYST